MRQRLHLSRMRIVLATIFAVVASGLAAGLALSSSDPVEEAVLTPIDYAGNSLVAGEPDLLGLSPGGKLEAVVDRMGSSKIAAAETGGPPSEPLGTQATGIDGPEPVFSPGTWAHFVVAAESESDVSVLQGEWEASLAAGVLRDALHADGSTPLAGITIDVQLPDGKVVPTGLGGIGNVAYQQQFETPDADTIEASIKAIAAEWGLTIHDLRLLAARQLAPIVIAETAEPKAAVEALPSIWGSLVGDPPRYEGFFLRINDSAGNPVAVSAFAFRLGAGMGWIRADLNPREPTPAPTTETVPGQESPG